MAWARVQSKTATSSGASSLSIVMTSTPVTGNVVIVYGAMGSSSPTLTVKDGNSNSLTAIKTVHDTVCGAGVFAYVVPATPSSTFTVTYNTAGSCTAMAQEISGIKATADGTPGGANGTTSPGSATYSSSTTNEFLVSYFGDEGNAITVTAPTGYTADANNVNASSDSDCMVVYKNSTGGSETASWTYSGTDDWGVITVAFQLASAGTTINPVTPKMPYVQAVRRAALY